MKFTCSLYIAILTIACLVQVPSALADETQIAVASNFTDAIRALAARFEARTPHHVRLIFGSTGKHYAQIRNGAPFDVFFAADVERPRLLERQGLIHAGSRFTYAIGKIVLWSPLKDYVDPEGKVLHHRDFRYLALANPELAPYGKAAQEVLTTRGLWDRLQNRMVRGENIEQTFQFINSGNAELGFVAYSQIRRAGRFIGGSVWEIPQALYAPIEQQAGLIREDETARAFLSFVQSDEARALIRSFGYETP